jgi:hypothetical protein
MAPRIMPSHIVMGLPSIVNVHPHLHSIPRDNWRVIGVTAHIAIRRCLCKILNLLTAAFSGFVWRFRDRSAERTRTCRVFEPVRNLLHRGHRGPVGTRPSFSPRQQTVYTDTSPISLPFLKSALEPDARRLSYLTAKRTKASTDFHVVGSVGPATTSPVSSSRTPIKPRFVRIIVIGGFALEDESPARRIVRARMLVS